MLHDKLDVYISLMATVIRMNGIQMYWYEPKIYSQLEFRHVQKTDGSSAHHVSVFHEGQEAY